MGLEGAIIKGIIAAEKAAGTIGKVAEVAKEAKEFLPESLETTEKVAKDMGKKGYWEIGSIKVELPKEFDEVKTDFPGLPKEFELSEQDLLESKQSSALRERGIEDPTDCSDKADDSSVQPNGTGEIEEVPDRSENSGREKASVLIDNPDIPEDEVSEGVQENDTAENKFLSSYKERMDQTPKESSDRGEWDGARGESKYIPSNAEIKDILRKYGIDGIEYKDAVPDFSKCSECTVEINDMTEKRRGPGGNFEQCDKACAEQWNKEARDGKTDWTADAVRKWREENGYSWHERNDMKTCDLVPTKVNDYFGHLGGVGECCRRDAKADFGGEFDE